MGLLSFLFGNTPRETDPAPDIQPNNDHAGGAIWMPSLETQATQVEEATFLRSDIAHDQRWPASYWEAAHSDATEPLFCMIDYTDAAGQCSRRRITIRRIIDKDGQLYVGAYCHERKAPRTFRFDRIRYFISPDGELFEPERFLSDNISADEPAPPQSAGNSNPRMHRQAFHFSRYTSPAVLLLIAAAKSDDHLHPAEAEQIHRYVEREAMLLLQAGHIDIAPTVEKLDIIGRRITHLRPTREDIAGALAEVRTRPADQIERLQHWLQQVIVADGRVHVAEDKFMAEFNRFLALSDADAREELSWMILESEAALIRENAARPTQPVTEPAKPLLEGLTIVFTGQMESISHPEAAARAKLAGAKVVGTVGRDVDIVILGAASGGKRTLAEKLGIRTIGEDEFVRLLEGE